MKYLRLSYILVERIQERNKGNIVAQNSEMIMRWMYKNPHDRAKV